MPEKEQQNDHTEDLRYRLHGAHGAITGGVRMTLTQLLKTAWWLLKYRLTRTKP